MTHQRASCDSQGSTPSKRNATTQTACASDFHDMAEQVGASPTRTQLDEVRQHPTFVATTLLFALVVARVLIVTDFRASTALAVVAAAGVVDVALGVIVSSWWVLVVGIYVIADARRRTTSDDVTADRAFNIQSASAIFLLVLAPWVVTAALAAFFLLSAWLDRKATAAGQPPDPWKGAKFLSLGLIALLVLMPTMWLPVEVLQREGQDDPWVGYVLSVEDEWTSIFVEPERDVRRVRSETVTERLLCKLGTGMPENSVLGILLSDRATIECETILGRPIFE